MMIENMLVSGMELEDMLPLQQMVNLDQDDHRLEDGDARLREQVMSPRESTSECGSRPTILFCK